MTQDELNELKTAIDSHAQQDAHGARVFARLAEHIAALDERVKRLEKPKKSASKNNEEGE